MHTPLSQLPKCSPLAAPLLHPLLVLQAGTQSAVWIILYVIFWIMLNNNDGRHSIWCQYFFTGLLRVLPQAAGWVHPAGLFLESETLPSDFFLLPTAGGGTRLAAQEHPQPQPRACLVPFSSH